MTHRCLLHGVPYETMRAISHKYRHIIAESMFTTITLIKMMQLT